MRSELYEFAADVVDALNQARVVPPDRDEFLSALMLVVGPKEKGDQLVGVSINYKDDGWTVTPGDDDVEIERVQ